jgi:hypothetical protein
MPLLALAAGSTWCTAAMVLDQIGTLSEYDLNAGTGPTASQVFTDFPDFSSLVLEDFTVTADELEITDVAALFRAQGGFAKFADVDGYALQIFSNPSLAAAGLGGDVASLIVLAGSGASVTQVIDSGGSFEYGLVSLETSVFLPSAGQYWIGVAPIAASSVAGQFRLMNSGASDPVNPGGTDARLANPGEGFGLGALSIVNLDHAYSVNAVPEPCSAVCAIAGLGMFLRRKRR